MQDWPIPLSAGRRSPEHRINFGLQTLISLVTLAGFSIVQAPMGIAIARHVILREVADGSYFGGSPVAAGVSYAGIAFYVFGHWAAVESGLSESRLGSLAYNMLRWKEYLISHGIILVCGAFANVLIAAAAARAYQMRIERSLSGAAEIFS